MDQEYSYSSSLHLDEIWRQIDFIMTSAHSLPYILLEDGQKITKYEYFHQYIEHWVNHINFTVLRFVRVVIQDQSCGSYVVCSEEIYTCAIANIVVLIFLATLSRKVAKIFFRPSCWIILGKGFEELL